MTHRDDSDLRGALEVYREARRCYLDTCYKVALLKKELEGLLVLKQAAISEYQRAIKAMARTIEVEIGVEVDNEAE